MRSVLDMQGPHCSHKISAWLECPGRRAFGAAPPRERKQHSQTSERGVPGRVHSLLSGLDLRSAIDISLCEAVLPSLSGLGSAVRIASLPVSVSAASPPDGLYQLTSSMNALVQQQLSGVSPATFAVIFTAGLLTSLSPCTLSVLPLTLGYIGGYASEGGRSSTSESVVRAVCFSFGLATTLALLGVGSSLLGKTYGQIGSGLPIAVALVAIAMGLNLLEVLPLRLPSLDLDVRNVSAPAPLQAYLVGLTFALAASPCSTPVLATLLAYVASSQDPWLGGGLLLAYTTGYVGPLLLAATAAGTLKQLLSLRQYSAWITPASGVLLLSGGTYTLLSRVL